jgi:hypothetical protein
VSAYVVFDCYWDALSSDANREEAEAAMPPGCHIVFKKDGVPGSLYAGISPTEFEDFLASFGEMRSGAH